VTCLLGEARASPGYRRRHCFEEHQEALQEEKNATRTSRGREAVAAAAMATAALFRSGVTKHGDAWAKRAEGTTTRTRKARRRSLSLLLGAARHVADRPTAHASRCLAATTVRHVDWCMRALGVRLSVGQDTWRAEGSTTTDARISTPTCGCSATWQNGQHTRAWAR
jgi:hypothetical protein